MRIIAGDYRGRRLKPVPGNKTRPTTDKIKESVFNIVRPFLGYTGCLDLYAGSGALGIEAVSRGYDQAVLVDHQYQAIKTIKENVNLTHDESQFVVLKADSQVALRQLAKQYQFDLVFLDPPYAKQAIVRDITQLQVLHLLTSQAIVVVETDTNASLPEAIDDCHLLKTNRYGITMIRIYQYKGE